MLAHTDFYTILFIEEIVRAYFVPSEHNRFLIVIYLDDIGM